MISVEEAAARLAALTPPPVPETVRLRDANGRVLLSNDVAKITQPPFDGSAMDGYAVRGEDAVVGRTLSVIGESRAGERFTGQVSPGQAVRIFTGAPVPEGANHVVIQEDVERDADTITIQPNLGAGTNIRPAGGDFSEGDVWPAPRRLTYRDIGLLAAMNVPEVAVGKRPAVALISTGDELVEPGETPSPDQIVSSNALAVAALVQDAGGSPQILPIARDTPEALGSVFDLAQGADIIVTLGGASVGDHDLVASLGQQKGLELDFYKMAMRPGKPMMAGRMGQSAMLGLPGNPVSALVCGTLFLAPMILAAQGLPYALPQTEQAIAGHDMPANGPRAHYMRAMLREGAVHAWESQDSSRLRTLAEANVLITRPPHDPVRAAGEPISIIRL